MLTFPIAIKNTLPKPKNKYHQLPFHCTKSDPCCIQNNVYAQIFINIFAIKNTFYNIYPHYQHCTKASLKAKPAHWSRFSLIYLDCLSKVSLEPL